MPYEPFLLAARKERYDIEAASVPRELRTGLSSLDDAAGGRDGKAFVSHDPHHIAGNISKRFRRLGLPFPRFNGACPRWNVFERF